jgi:hypothetical protein
MQAAEHVLQPPLQAQPLCLSSGPARSVGHHQCPLSKHQVCFVLPLLLLPPTAMPRLQSPTPQLHAPRPCFPAITLQLLLCWQCTTTKPLTCPPPSPSHTPLPLPTPPAPLYRQLNKLITSYSAHFSPSHCAAAVALLAGFTTGRDLSPEVLDSAYRGPAAKVGTTPGGGGGYFGQADFQVFGGLVISSQTYHQKTPEA